MMRQSFFKRPSSLAGAGGGVGAAPGLNLMPVFDAPLRSSLAARTGQAPTFTRATAAQILDWEGVVRTVLSGEARFYGARRVYNVVATKSEDFSNAAWTKSNVTASTATRLTATAGNGTVLQTFTAVAQSWVMRVRLTRVTGTGNIQLTLDGGSTWTTVTLTATAQVFSIAQSAVANPQFGIRIVTSGDAIDADQIQVESTQGNSNANPSEYVSVGVLSSPYHGVGVDGVKCFDSQNGNTVASNVVTEAAGALLASTVTEGWYREPAKTNLALYSNDHSNAVWAPTSLTVTPNDAVAPDGFQTAALLTATGAAATLLQDLGVLASASRNYTVWLKRKTGTGTIQIRCNSAGTYTTVSITSSWARYTVNVTGSDPDIGIRMATSGDEIWVWGSCAFATTTGVSFGGANIIDLGIETQGVAVAVNEDVLTYAAPANIGTEGQCYAEIRPRATFPSTGPGVVTIDDGTAANYVKSFGSFSTAGTAFQVMTSSVSQGLCQDSNGAVNAVYRVGGQWRVNSFRSILEADMTGTSWLVTSDTSGTMPAGLTTIRIGSGAAGAEPWAGAIRRVKIFNYVLRAAVGGGGALWDLHKAGLLGN